MDLIGFGSRGAGGRGVSIAFMFGGIVVGGDWNLAVAPEIICGKGLAWVSLTGSLSVDNNEDIENALCVFIVCRCLACSDSTL